MGRSDFYNETGHLSEHKHQLPAFVFGNNRQAAHFDHCLDRLTLFIMCHGGDMTPSPSYNFERVLLVFGKSGFHTCQRFEPTRAWMDKRISNGKADHWAWLESPT